MSAMKGLQLFAPSVTTMDSVFVVLLVVLGSIAATGGADRFITSKTNSNRKITHRQSNSGGTNKAASAAELATVKYRRPEPRTKPPESRSNRKLQKRPLLSESSSESEMSDDSAGSSWSWGSRRRSHSSSEHSSRDILPAFEFLGEEEVVGNRRRIKSADDANGCFSSKDYQQKRSPLNFLRRKSLNNSPEGSTVSPPPPPPFHYGNRQSSSRGVDNATSESSFPSPLLMRPKRAQSPRSSPRSTRQPNQVVDLLFNTDDLF